MRGKYSAGLLALAAALALTMAGCGGTEEPLSDEPAAEAAPVLTAEPDPNPPVTPPAERGVVLPPAAPEATAFPRATARPTATPAPTPTATPAPTPSLRPGEYIGSDGSILTVNGDGTCAYEATVSGTVNGRAMSGRLTFHGTVEDGAFSFTKVTYYGLDLTAIAKSAGYEDASYWEAAAAIIYGG